MQNTLRPETIQRIARRASPSSSAASGPAGCSLPADAKTVPSRAISASVSPNAPERRSSCPAVAICQRRTTFSRYARCMFTPRVSAASPRASRLEATSTSCTDVTPSPPSSSGIGAVKYPLCLTRGEAVEGEAPVAVVGAQRAARSCARASRRAPRGARRTRFWLSVRETSCLLLVWLNRRVEASGWRRFRGRRQPLPSWSRSRHVHRDGDAVRDHVEDGRAPLCALDDLPQLLLGRVALRRGTRRGSARSRCGARPTGRARPARPCRPRASTRPRSGGRRGRRRRRRATWSGRRRARAAGASAGIRARCRCRAGSPARRRRS